MKSALTDLTIRNLKHDGKQHFIRDAAFPGFGLRLSQKGGKSFFVIRDRKYHHLGRYPATTLAEARKRAANLEPSHTALSYREAVDLYMSTYVRPNYRPRSAKEVERLLAKLPDQPLYDISTKTITDVLDKLLPSEANHTFGVLRTFFSWAERREIIPHSPIRQLQKPHRETSRSRVLTPDEIRRVWIATSTEKPFNLIIRLCLLTGQRRGEIAAIQPTWCTEGLLTIPATITKNKREHSIPLTTYALSSANSYLSLTKSSTVYNTWSKPKADLDKRANVHNWVIHDLRRTFSSNLGAMGTPPHVIDALLNHHSSSLHKTYNRYLYMNEMRQALEVWQTRLLDIVGEKA